MGNCEVTDRIIIVNGKRVAWNWLQISYEQLNEIAKAVSPTVTYRHGLADQYGEMIPGQRVITVDGMVFNVVNTSSA